MRFLLDACAASRSMHEALTGQGHDVLSALEAMPRSPDDELLAVALAEERILITEDKDFGELVFVRRLPHPCIIRFTDMPIGEKVDAMLELIERSEEAMRGGSIIVVTRSRVRIRHGEDGKA